MYSLCEHMHHVFSSFHHVFDLMCSRMYLLTDVKIDPLLSLSGCPVFSISWPSWTVRAGLDVQRLIGIGTVCSCCGRRRLCSRRSLYLTSSSTPQTRCSSCRRRNTSWRRRCRKPRVSRVREPIRGLLYFFIQSCLWNRVDLLDRFCGCLACVVSQLGNSEGLVGRSCRPSYIHVKKETMH